MVGPPPDSWEVDAAAASARAVVPGLWRLRLPMPYPHISHANAYLLDGAGGGVVLVDCGGGGHESAWEALCRALAEAGRAPSDVRDLVITHFHSDHMGCATRLVAETGCTVWAHPASEHFLGAHAEPARHRAQRERWVHRLGVAPGPFAEDCADVREETDGIDGPVRADHLLLAGTAVPSALGDWEVVEAPGHAPSQVCLRQREHRILIAGDLVGPVFAPYFDIGFTPDPVAEHLASLERADALGAELALPGHGRPLTALPELFSENRRGVAERLDAVRAAVAERAGATGAELLDAVFPAPENAADRVWRLFELASYLEHLSRVGEIGGEADAAGVVWWSTRVRAAGSGNSLH